MLDAELLAVLDKLKLRERCQPLLEEEAITELGLLSAMGDYAVENLVDIGFTTADAEALVGATSTEEAVELETNDDDDELQLEGNGDDDDDDDDELQLEGNGDDDDDNDDDDDDDELQLEDNGGGDDDDDDLQLEDNDESEDELQLEENDESEDELMLQDNDDDDEGLTLEDNDDGDELQLEKNSDEDGLQLEENSEHDGELQLEENDNDDDELELELEQNDEHEIEQISTEAAGAFFMGGQGLYGTGAGANAPQGQPYAGFGGQQSPYGQGGLYGQQPAYDGQVGLYGQQQPGEQPAYGTGAAGAANPGLQEALNALNTGSEGLMIGAEDPMTLLPPQAKQMLDEALAAAPDHPHGEQAKMLDTLQKMTAHL